MHHTRTKFPWSTCGIVCAAVLLLLPQVVDAQSTYFDSRYHWFTYRYDPMIRQKQRWAEEETRAFHRLARSLKADERQSRRAIERLAERKTHLKRWLNGGTHSLDRAALWTALRDLTPSGVHSELLSVRVPAMTPTELGSMKPYGLVKSDGTLTRPPYVLHDGTKGYPTHAACLRFVDCWKRARGTVSQGRMARPADIAGLESALVEWRDGSSEVIRFARRTEQAAAKMYLRKADRLIAQLKNEISTYKLTTHLSQGREGFPGGTLADFVGFAQESGISVESGTPAHAVLVALVPDMLRNLNFELAQLEGEVGLLKAQNPAHNAAVKKMLIGEVDRGSGGSYWSIGSRPTLFNFPQGAQPAGLQSQAYAVRTPAANSSQPPDMDRLAQR